MSQKLSTATRREFLRRAGALVGMTAPGALPLATLLAASGQAAAQTAGDYKALVCVFLNGGNDSFNTVLATDAPAWAAYQGVRNQVPDSIALLAAGTLPDASAAAGSPARLGGVLPLTLAGRSLAVHPLLGGLANNFNISKRLAVLANVGPLVQPTSKAQYASIGHPKPAKLFSHNDQQNLWQALSPEGARSGWGGRMADRLMSDNSRAMFTAISASGASVWLAGQTARQYQVSTNGAIRIGSGNSLFGSTAGFAAMQQIMRNSRGTHVLEHDHADVVARSVDAEVQLSSALPAASDGAWGTAPSTGSYNADTDPLLRYTSAITGNATTNPLARQLQMVARCIAARGTLGMKRQVFFVNLGGFDTHDNQNRNHADLMARLDHGLSYFDRTLVSMGAAPLVTTFTASDFGRTFTSNGDGTDHGWGSHQFVMGGAVRSGLYGDWPTLGAKNSANNDFDSSTDQLRNGALLPTTSVEQMGATLARWMGVSDSQALEIFPNLANFDVSKRHLGFLSAPA
ncbi:protein of unknown function DUF1501 [Leptothrix cholodnii SP-6]|uniref:DUF1501 domain-containing protein n=1 Tax=Leptothrix cholodnii (strain ATCC 51168 / LMG 8142 / SP-6) TaxID=395495 RepID=B1Y4T9_LEPCP|nr:DUF1501 domain-containing protein [Leptothrix cholodnii]ACB34652.1 protein of unknown function DUF1501 [Leptothrix cholodnii SP-6]